MKFQALEGLKISSFRRVEIKRKSRWFKLKGVTHAYLGPIWHRKEPADIPYPPNQFLGWYFFSCFYNNKTALQIVLNLCILQKNPLTNKLDYFFLKFHFDKFFYLNHITFSSQIDIFSTRTWCWKYLAARYVVKSHEV